ncbi:hypothetical protein BU23DRAFT_572522 [Bimuria novae-zelandiae CBS 107.79]|uniref:Uncharacterized protein n=1 Tax=Bimuria novae-zelandiae CBS 107.79 TaxID=1447943 RepID=A0A6A5UV39_9PLEO|nr:hypothetical protein BU23DRAFT_572522 [Bimuria novae-zelandiae CBS 107.79]
MHTKFIIAMAAALNTASVLATPVSALSPEKRQSETEFASKQYPHLYKKTTDAGLAKRQRETEFASKQYPKFYKEALDAGLADVEKRQSGTELHSAAYSHLYKQSSDARIVEG